LERIPPEYNSEELLLQQTCCVSLYHFCNVCKPIFYFTQITFQTACLAIITQSCQDNLMLLFQREDKFSLIYLITLFHLYRLYIVKQKDDLVQQIWTNIWKEAGITYLNALLHHSHVTQQKNHQYRQSEQLECNMVNI